MLVVSKQRVMRHKLNTDVNLIFSENVLVHTIIYKAHKLVLFTYITSTLLLSVMRSSLLVVVLGGICTCSFLLRNAQSLVFSPNGLWFKMQAGQQVAITVACSCKMLVPVRSVLCFLAFVIC